MGEMRVRSYYYYRRIVREWIVANVITLSLYLAGRLVGRARVVVFSCALLRLFPKRNSAIFEERKIICPVDE